MATKTWTPGTIALAGAATLVLGWLIFSPTKTAASSPSPTPLPPGKPPSTYVPGPDVPPPPPPVPTLVGPWCSAVPSAGPPSALDAATVAYVRANADQAVPYLWMMLALYVMGYAENVPNADMVREAGEHTSGFDWQTQKAVDSLLPGRRGLEIPNGRTLLDVYRAFSSRDATRDRPCPVLIPDDLVEKLTNSYRETQRLADAGV